MKSIYDRADATARDLHEITCNINCMSALLCLFYYHMNLWPPPPFSGSADSMQVTISLLPVSLSLVHIPRSRLAQLSHPILRQILQPNHTFINVSCNEIELSLFAEHHMLADFEPIARHDRQRQRSRSGSGSGKKNMAQNFPEPVEISYEKWNVLQIGVYFDKPL